MACIIQSNFQISYNFYSLEDCVTRLYHDMSDIKFDIISANEHAERAFNLGLAAVLGEGIYNFGELVSLFGFLLYLLFCT